MESPEDIEKALSKLMPSAISGKGQRSLEDLIDGLAGDGEAPAIDTPRVSPWPWIGGIGAAAAAVALGWMLPGGPPSAADSPVTKIETPAAPAEGIVLIQQSERVEAAVPEDWMSESDGVAYRAWRVRVIDEERVQDVKTGYEVLVSNPREEVRLLPVSTF